MSVIISVFVLPISSVLFSHTQDCEYRGCGFKLDKFFVSKCAM